MPEISVVLEQTLSERCSSVWYVFAGKWTCLFFQFAQQLGVRVLYGWSYTAVLSELVIYSIQSEAS